MNCFLCNKDITNTTKVISYHHFPSAQEIIYKFLELGVIKEIPKDKSYQDTLLDLGYSHVNEALCTKCASKDLEYQHKEYMKDSVKKEEQRIEDSYKRERKDKEIRWYTRLFKRLMFWKELLNNEPNN